MKLALLTDLHANREAFEACLDHAHRCGATDYAILGDLVGYGADPAWVVDTVRALASRGAIVLKGNHDESAAEGPRPTMVEDARQVIAWTRAQLDAAQLAFLEALPLTVERAGCLFAHANTWAPADWEYVTSRHDAVRCLQATTARHVFIGHVHEPQLYHLAGTGKTGQFTPVSGVAIPVPAHRQWLVLPGSVGQPRDGNPAACWALYDSDSLNLSFHRVPYDQEAAAAKIRRAGLPERLAQRLIEGR
ncbi:metallophosphoesterase family protein [Methylibium sp.]|uniref:metallophosphoesterase family protein n=1 Tax=Methylibium sp. TaxID=2067992 RepID=UPI003D13FCF6